MSDKGGLGMPMDPQKSRAILIGVGDYTEDRKNLDPVPQVRNNIKELTQLLNDENVAGFSPDHVTTVIDERNDVIGRKLKEASQKTEDTLLVYYVGHGEVTTNKYYLTGTNSVVSDIEFSGIPFDTIRDTLNFSSAKRKILILDSCFSGRATPSLASSTSVINANIEQITSGGFVLASSPSNQTTPAISPDKQYTGFTALLLSVLSKGVSNRRGRYSLGELYKEVKRLAAQMPELPDPRTHYSQEMFEFELFNNPSYVTTPNPVDFLILEARFACLKKSLTQADEAVKLVKKAWDEADELHRVLFDMSDGIEPVLENVKSRLRVARNILDGEISGSIDEVRKGVPDNILSTRRQIGEAEGDVENLLDMNLEKAYDIVTRMKARAERVREGSFVKKLMAGVTNQIVSCNEIIDKEGISNMEVARQAFHQGDIGIFEKHISKAWTKSNEAYKKSQPIFEEYVDFMAGVALRDTGFFERLCQMADELIAKCYWIPKTANAESLFIPVHHGGVKNTLTRNIIRLGYPEWTLWALPLVAHEYGQLLVDRTDLPRCTEGSLSDDNNVFMADAFATYVLGPAYACAALLLQFDPWSAEKNSIEQSISMKRAHFVFSMLERIDDDYSGIYSPIIDKLKNGWKAALHQQGKTTELDDENRGRLDQCVAIMKHNLDNIGLLNPPKDAIVRQWADHLLEDNGRALDVDGVTDFSEVLNAAWICRLNKQQEPVDVEDIRHAAVHLWDRIQLKR
jgi:hypothetical protein